MHRTVRGAVKWSSLAEGDRVQKPRGSEEDWVVKPALATGLPDCFWMVRTGIG